jgi:hypothetical protein
MSKKLHIYIYIYINEFFSFWSPRILYKHIDLWFLQDSIEISWYWKKLMNIYEIDNERKTHDLINGKKHDRKL